MSSASGLRGASVALGRRCCSTPSAISRREARRASALWWTGRTRPAPCLYEQVGMRLVRRTDTYEETLS
jgi:hypothetical protein